MIVENEPTRETVPEADNTTAEELVAGEREAEWVQTITGALLAGEISARSLREALLTAGKDSEVPRFEEMTRAEHQARRFGLASLANGDAARFECTVPNPLDPRAIRGDLREVERLAVINGDGIFIGMVSFWRMSHWSLADVARHLGDMEAVPG